MYEYKNSFSIDEPLRPLCRFVPCIRWGAWTSHAIEKVRPNNAEEIPEGLYAFGQCFVSNRKQTSLFSSILGGKHGDQKLA